MYNVNCNIYTIYTVNIKTCNKNFTLRVWRRALAQRGKRFSFSFRDAELQPVIPSNAKKNHGNSPKHLRPGINISLTIIDPCLPSNTWQCSDVWHFRTLNVYPEIRQDNPSSLFPMLGCVCLPKTEFKNFVLMVLLQIGFHSEQFTNPAKLRSK